MKPKFVSDSEWKILQQYCSKYGVPPELVAAIGWHETQWGRAGAGRQGYYLGVGVPSKGPILSSAAGLERQLTTRMLYTGKPWIASLGDYVARYGVNYNAVLAFGREVHRPDDPYSWARSIWSIYTNMLGGEESEVPASLPTGNPPWLTPLEECYFTKPLNPMREDQHSEIDPTKYDFDKLSKMSCYNEVLYNCRGRLLQAFPTFLVMFIDEGEWVGGRKLWDNFYFYHSMVELSVVKERGNPADLAYLQLTNVYGALNHYTLPPGIESASFIQKLFPAITQHSIDLRKRLFTDLMIRPGARVHIRMGYGSSASRLPTVFNGVITEINAEDTATFIAQGDGHELLNELVQFDPADYTSRFQLGNEPLDIIRHLMCARGTMFHFGTKFVSSWIKKMNKDVAIDFGKDYVFGAYNPFHIEHFGTVRRDSAEAIYTGKDIKTWDVMMNIYPTTINMGELNRLWRDRLANKTKAKKQNKSFLDTLKSLYDSAADAIKEITQEIFDERNIGVWLGQKTVWDIIRILARSTTGYVASVFPFQFRSSLFFGLPWWPVCIKYRRKG